MKMHKEHRFAGLTGTVLILLLLIIDQWTKKLACTCLKGSKEIILLPGILKLDYVENRGVAFGLFEGYKILMIVFTIFFLFILFYMIWKIPFTKQYFMVWVCIIFMFAGAIGNFVDRIKNGYVIDFIYFYLIDFPVFNFADVFVVSGGILWIILLFFKYDEDDFEFLYLKNRRG